MSAHCLSETLSDFLTARPTAFINDDGTGFAEGNFLAVCPLPGCSLKIKNDNLAVAKFVRDLSEVNGAQEHFVA